MITRSEYVEGKATAVNVKKQNRHGQAESTLDDTIRRQGTHHTIRL